jgi:hypothetical protein
MENLHTGALTWGILIENVQQLQANQDTLLTGYGLGSSIHIYYCHLLYYNFM